MMQMRKVWLVLVAVLGLCAALAGCGGGSHQQHHHARPTGQRQFSVTLSGAPGGQRETVVPRTSSTGQRSYSVTRPGGQRVTELHNPALAIVPPSQRPPVASTTGTVEQYDSVTTSTVPGDARYVAGYVDGLYQTYKPLKLRFPSATVVGISVSRNDGADCLDMEPGNPGPDAAGPWASWQMNPINGNDRPCEYSMESWFPQINDNLRAWHIAVCVSATQTHCVLEWDANWTYVLHRDAGYPCTQWTDRSRGLNLDESTCVTWFYHHAAPPPPDPFRIFPSTVFALAHGARAQEHKTVATWYRDHCNRHHLTGRGCISTYYNLRLLRDREYWVAGHKVVHGHWVTVAHRRWADDRLGERFAWTSKIVLH